MGSRGWPAPSDNRPIDREEDWMQLWFGWIQFAEYGKERRKELVVQVKNLAKFEKKNLKDTTWNCNTGRKNCCENNPRDR